ncbi:hypothetical protein M0Q97_01660 [Candidatus Dojkabacteria bacterium]|jgi:hypothetical protein|nr:hypothetical protein [Candidatus Dojkabacteria bacterium]
MKYIYKINEFRNQLEIPFDNKHPLYDKPPHIHIIDRLEDISNELKISPDKYYSNWTIYDIEKTWNKYFDSALKIFLNEHDIFYSDDSFYYEGTCVFLDEYDIIDNQDLFNDEIVNYIIENPDCDSRDIIKKFDLYIDLSEYIIQKMKN